VKKPGDQYDRDFYLVPKHVFDEVHKDCNKYLLSIFEDDTTDVDGCHGDAQGVAKAKVLISRLGLGPKERKSVMITVEVVPEFTGKVNEEAIATLAPVIKRYKNRKGIR
jgi:hypothetical protein